MKPNEEKEQKIVIVYTTTGSEAEAKRIGWDLVSKKLAACVNIIPNMHSIYSWKDNIEEANECVMLVKTGESNVPAIIDTIKTMHSYELPCIIVLPIIGGLEKYIDYIISETHADKRLRNASFK